MFTPALSRLRSRKAFSLIELAVVLIVIGVIAAIAIPTFLTVITRAELRSDVATQDAVARNVTAILALQDGTTPAQALTIALSGNQITYGGATYTMSGSVTSGSTYAFSVTANNDSGAGPTTTREYNTA